MTDPTVQAAIAAPAYCLPADTIVLVDRALQSYDDRQIGKPLQTCACGDRAYRDTPTCFRCRQIAKLNTSPMRQKPHATNLSPTGKG